MASAEAGVAGLSLDVRGSEEMVMSRMWWQFSGGALREVTLASPDKLKQAFQKSASDEAAATMGR
ncbi:hypothetical protein [Paracoccus benzoatiresistens]|uniref:WYL domain-containing protein n=1 Tax=Paracoccus benzoatiresistens TaxID=2997341 RepID=A0ABT4J9H7_9RHOB|nr:hypothetical protein [Paracoccus sp. EF6]MCZ0963786.1 hypothetical protein [Paracoccus sp. EF6]